MDICAFQFENMKVDFHMEKLSVSIKDKDEIIKLTVEDLKAMLTQRSGAQALKYALLS